MNVRMLMIEGEADAPTLAAISAALVGLPHVRLAEPEEPFPFARLARWVALEMGVSESAMRSAQQHKAAVRARDALAWGGHALLGLTYMQIGRELGNRDHSTIITAVRRAAARIDADSAFGRLITRMAAEFAA